MNDLEHGQLLGAMNEKLDILLDRTADHGKRIQTLEQLRYWAAGVLVVISTMLLPKIKALVGL
jgi:hypothetical protein